MAISLGGMDVRRSGCISQVQHHERFETAALGGLRQQALTVSGGLCSILHWGHQIGHGDGAGKDAGGMGNSVLQRDTVPEVHMPVIGAGKGEFVHDNCLG